MVNTRRDLIANKNVNKYSPAGLGMLEPHDWLLSPVAGKVCGSKGLFPTWEFSSTEHVSPLIISGAWITHHPTNIIFCPSLSGLEELLPSALLRPPLPFPPLPHFPSPLFPSPQHLDRF